MDQQRRFYFKWLIYAVLMAFFLGAVWVIFHFEPITQKDF